MLQGRDTGGGSRGCDTGGGVEGGSYVLANHGVRRQSVHELAWCRGGRFRRLHKLTQGAGHGDAALVTALGSPPVTWLLLGEGRWGEEKAGEGERTPV